MNAMVAEDLLARLNREELRWLAARCNVKQGRNKTETIRNLVADPAFLQKFFDQLESKIGDIYLGLVL